MNALILHRAAACGILALAIAAPGAAALAADTPASSPAPAASPAAAPTVPPLVAAAEDPKVGAFARATYEQIRAGAIDRTKLAPVISNAITPALEATLASQFGSLGDPVWHYDGYRETPNGRVHQYLLTYKAVALHMQFGVDKAGLVNNLLFQPVKAS